MITSLREARRAILLIAATGASLAAQPRELTLKAASATLDHEFTRISSIRELSDGRVLISEDDALLVVDFLSGAVQRIGARGAGPLEYRDVLALIPLADDTTLMADASNGRLMYLHRDRILRVTPVNDTLMTLLGWDLRGADSRGNVLARRQIAPAGFTMPRQRNGVAFVRVQRGSAKLDTVAVGKGMEMEVTPVGPRERKAIRTMTVALAVEDPAVLFADGWIAVGRQEPYRIDWYPPIGPPRVGRPIETSAPRIDAAEQADWRRGVEEYTGKPLPPSFASMAFAEFIAPFGDALQALPDGRLLVPRHKWSGSRGTEFDIIDRQGDRVARMRLPANERVVGVGRAAMYVVARDEDGIERLRRHPWP